VSAAVVDTSAWIDYFAGRDIPLLDAALKQGIIILPAIVVAELVSGARKRREREAMMEFLDELPIHETPRDHWVRVGELRLQCRERVSQFPLPTRMWRNALWILMVVVRAGRSILKDRT
jgi:predicted nucleic acid-binding protein